MIRAASTTDASACTVVGFEVITSLTFFPIPPPSRLQLVCGFPARAGAKRTECGRADGNDREEDHRAGALVPGGLRGPAVGRLPGLQGGPEQGLRLGHRPRRGRGRDGQADPGGARDRPPAAVRADRQPRRPLRLDHRERDHEESLEAALEWLRESYWLKCPAELKAAVEGDD